MMNQLSVMGKQIQLLENDLGTKANKLLQQLVVQPTTTTFNCDLLRSRLIPELQEQNKANESVPELSEEAELQLIRFNNMCIQLEEHYRNELETQNRMASDSSGTLSLALFLLLQFGN